MNALSIVEAFDPIDDIELRLSPGFITGSIDAFDFQGLEKALHRCIVPAVPSPAHRLNHEVVLDQSPVRRAGVLTATVGVHDGPAPGRRNPYADFNAWVTSSVFIRSLIDQPTILRLARSMTQAR